MGHGFVDLHGRMIDLNCLIPTESGLVITDAEDMNDRGQIVAQRYETSDPTTDLALLLDSTRSDRRSDVRSQESGERADRPPTLN